PAPVADIVERTEAAHRAEPLLREIHGHGLETDPQPVVAAEIIRLANAIGVKGRALGTRMGLPDERALALSHVVKLRGAAGVVDGAVLRVLLQEGLPFAANVGPVDRLRKQDVVMAAEIFVGLFARQNQKIPVGMAAAGFVICFEILEAKRAGISGMALAVEI